MEHKTVTKQIEEIIQDGIDLRFKLAEACSNDIAQAAITMVKSLQYGGKVLLFGNGGSAADAQHIAAEFIGRFKENRHPLPALALTTDTSALTAIGNDYGFQKIFSRQIQALGKLEDVVVAISTSGRSPNVIAGVEAARECGLVTIGLTGGNGGGRLASMVDISIVVPSVNTARIQECHITIGHILCEIVESTLFGYVKHTIDPTKYSRNILTSDMPCHNGKVVDWDTLMALRKQWMAEDKRVVWTNGCFDLLHIGHVHCLQKARSLGDILVVGVNSDDLVRQLKGPGRPVVLTSERVQILAALECVDYVVVFKELTPENALARLKPDIHCKGADYAPPQGKPMPEVRVVESYGGQIKFLPFTPSSSTSALIRRILKQCRSEMNVNENL